MDDVGKREYKRVTGLLNELPIADLDRTLVAIYCNSYSKYIQATKDIDANGITMLEADSNGSKRKKKNPAVAIMSEMSREIRNIANSLGMTIDSRMRLVAPQQQTKEDDPYSQFSNAVGEDDDEE
ncbi:phage terminase small subunit P27 family [Heyndrickxia coagulans]|uniref:phage terminase small subunit P27 family n=1 Tax=Heyndrickxia coagulans TaxID=1398 RepID=UPI002E05A156|nr:phage terminase small subunit P27 family [Heyndrickxia coagulans]